MTRFSTKVYRFKGKLLKLVIQEKRLPNGRKVRLEIIEHPGAVLIVPFLTKEKIILIRQYRPAVGRFLYELPAGTLNFGETTAICARRELIEEINYDAVKITKVKKICPVPGYSNEIITIFKAENLKMKEGFKDPDEIIQARVFTRRQIKNLIKKESILDAKTITGLALCGCL